VAHWVVDEIQVLVGQWALWADDTGFGEQETADLADELSVMMLMEIRDHRADKTL